MKKLILSAVLLSQSLLYGSENIFCQYGQIQTANQTRYSATCLNNMHPYPGTQPNPACIHYKTNHHPTLLKTQHASYCPPGHKPYVKKHYLVRRK